MIFKVSFIKKRIGATLFQKDIWLQSNCCLQKEAILFLSCATIPLKLFQFTGIIIVLVIDDKQYQFVFYYGAVLNTVERIGDVYYLVIEQRQYRIEIKMRTG